MKVYIIYLVVALGLEPTKALQNIFSGWGKEKNPLFSIPFSNQPSPMRERVDLGTLSVSPMGLGTLNLPLNAEVDEETTGVIKMVQECGVNFVDTAEAVSRSNLRTMW